jgi:hypothetical protein
MLGWWRARRAARERQGVFEQIYDRGAWGVGDAGERRSGRGSHDPAFVSTYVAAVQAFLAAEGPVGRLVDLGCGDFNVGRHFLGWASDYQAFDISPLIIRQNRARYADAPVSFGCRDIIAERLPRGDIACLRQVLQHLPNADIAGLVGRLNRQRPYRWLIVTEHVPTGEGWPRNADMPAGAVTRLLQGSGIDLAAAPFGLHYRAVRTLCTVPAPEDGQDACVQTLAYAL